MDFQLTTVSGLTQFNLVATDQTSTPETQSAVLQRIPRTPPIHLPQQAQFLLGGQL
jgi:hypothetical protein